MICYIIACVLFLGSCNASTYRPELYCRHRSVEALNTSKPLREAYGDVDDAVAAFRYCANQAEKLEERMSQPNEPLPAAEFSGKIRYEPVGVVAAICPWNLWVALA